MACRFPSPRFVVYVKAGPKRPTRVAGSLALDVQQAPKLYPCVATRRVICTWGGMTPAPSTEMTVLDYRGLESAWGLENCEVGFLLWRPAPLRMTPFQNWSSAEPPLHWYHEYNVVKHNRDAEFGRAKLRTLVEAIGAQFCLIAKVAEFDWGPMFSQSFQAGKGTFTRRPFEMTYSSNVIP